MGSEFSYFPPNDLEESAHQDGRCGCCDWLVHLFSFIFPRGELPAPLSVQRTTSEDTSLLDTYRAPPMPLPYDDPIFSGRHRKSSNFTKKSEALRRSFHHSNMETASSEDNLVRSKYGGVKLSCSAPSARNSPASFSSGSISHLSSSEDEDVCPVCLDEYTHENPIITLQCNHHYHLSCIYEWMERSEACPVCGKVMLFNEAG